MPEIEFDADAALNRVLGAITPFRQAANNATTQEQMHAVTQLGLGAALNALGEPLTQDRATALLFAAVLRLADVWNGEATTTIEIPDTPGDLT